MSKEQSDARPVWLTVVGSFLVYYSSFGIINSFGFFQKYYEDELLRGVPPSTIAFIGTIQVAFMNVLATVAGALCDSYGIRYLYIGSGCGTTIALIGLSLAKTDVVWQVFLCQGVLMGVTIAFGVQAALTVIGQHFKRKRSLAIGITTTGCAAGGVCFPIMFARLLPLIGFAWTMRVAALKIAVFYAIALQISTDKPSHKAMNNARRRLFDFDGFCDHRYSVLSFSAWIAQLGLFVPYYYLESYCTKTHPGDNRNGFFLPILNGTSLVGMIFGGFVGDLLGPLTILFPTTLLSGLLCITLWLLSTSYSFVIIFACLYGFCFGIYSALLPSAVSQISPNEKLGARIGAFYSVIAVSSLIGTPIGGAIVASREVEHVVEGYRYLIIYAGGALILGGLIMGVARWLHGGGIKGRW